MNDIVRKIVIVEDAVMVALHIKRSLETVGYEIPASFESGEETLKYLSENELPSLILMDVSLAGDLDGIKTAEKIKELYNVPVIYLTAISDKTTIERAKTTQPFGYVIKPFNERELHTNIAMAIHKSEVETKLRESEEKFYTTVMNVSDLLMTVDINGKIILLNQTFSDVLELNENYENAFFDEVFALTDMDSGKTRNLKKLLSSSPQKANSMYLSVRSNPNHKCAVGDFKISEIKELNNQVSGYVVVMQEITEKLKKEELEKKVAIMDLSASIKGQELERARVSRALHDGIGQILSAIKINIKILEKDTGNEITKNLNDYIEEAISEIKRISEDLMPLKLIELELTDCIQGLGNRFSGYAGHITIEGEVDDEKVDADTKLHVFRILQESLNNAVVHSNAKNISIQIRNDEENFYFSIEDDGVGFDLEDVLNGLKSEGRGIKNIRDRMKILNGRLEIDSDYKKGSFISGEVPLKK